MTWPTILSRSRPPPRGPLRSSAGARRRRVERRPGGLDERGQPLGLGRVDGRRVGRVGDAARDAEVGPRRRRSTRSTTSIVERRRANVRPAAAATVRVARRVGRAAPRSPSSSVLPERDQPGQSSAVAKTFFAPASTRPRGARSGRPGSRREGSAGLPQLADEARQRGRRRGRPRPSASTSAEATITPSAPAFASARTWAGRLTPNPTADRDRRGRASTSRTRRATCDGRLVRAPVTPTSETQYRKPPLASAISARRSGGVVGATR